MRFFYTLLVLSTAILPSWATSCDFEGGYSIRRQNSCGEGFVNCKSGAAIRCCPQGTYCHYEGEENKSGNAYCCPSETETCLQDVLNVPKCPSGNFSLWKRKNANKRQAFCCDLGRYGVTVSDGVGVACRDNGDALGEKEVAVLEFKEPESTCTNPSSTTISESATTDLEQTTTSETAEPSSEASLNVSSSDNSITGGAIAGIVVGSLAGVGFIAGLVTWFFRRRPQEQEEELKEESGINQDGGMYEISSSPICELPGDVRYGPGGSQAR